MTQLTNSARPASGPHADTYRAIAVPVERIQSGSDGMMELANRSSSAESRHLHRSATNAGAKFRYQADTPVLNSHVQVHVRSFQLRPKSNLILIQDSNRTLQKLSYNDVSCFTNTYPGICSPVSCTQTINRGKSYATNYGKLICIQIILNP